jgi:hypothetical protein
MEAAMPNQEKTPTNDGGIDFEDVELVHRFARSGTTAALRERDASASWDPEFEEKLEREWFEMGDQENWMEVRARAQVAREPPRKP